MEPKPGSYGIEHALKWSWIRSGYWKTLAGLRADRSTVTAKDTRLYFKDYPFAPAAVFPSGAVSVDQIAEVNLGYPSQVRLRSGDILFVASDSKEALMTFIHQNDVKVEHRGSLWSALLSPFLDTWEEQETIDREFASLAARGLDREAVTAWRLEIAPAMMAYNFGTRLWEWGVLTIYDVLRAQHARLSSSRFADFYARAMQVAQLDPVTSGWTPTSHGISDALSSALIEWYPREKGSLKNFGKQWDERYERVKALQRRLAAELTSAYSEPHRRYHTLAHVEHCLRELATVWQYAVHLEEIRWALLFHDAIYDPKRQDNEARSADWAVCLMDEWKRPKDEQERVRAMILATAHSGEARTADEALLLDIDLAILGADEARFDEYDRAIRVEYDWVPEDAYRAARGNVLESFLKRQPIYRTAPFRRRYEVSARKNLERALKKLRGE